MSRYQPQPPTAHTRAVLQRFADELPFANTEDFDDARRGFLGTVDTTGLKNASGLPIWDLTKFAFLDEAETEQTVNPSLLRLAKLNMFSGLFEVVPGVYQVRGFDLSNVTFIEGDTGVIVIDPLVSVEISALALELYREHRGERPVTAVIYTHSHADHYGGVKGVVSDEDVAEGRVRVIAPEGFLEEAVAENVFAGNAMQRRTIFQYGYLLPAGPRGAVDAGLGKGLSIGQTSLIAPTEHITETGQRITVDGVEIEFYMAPHTEAPAEFLLWFPKRRLLNAAEDVTHTIHNVLTLRGAQVRDTVAWWKALHGVLQRYGNEAEVIIAQHHWPVWGNERVRELISDQRDLYKYLHDEVLRLANSGHTIFEIPERIEIPDSIGKKWHNRDYYGSVHHNAKAVYQRYLGWWDGNPSTFYAHPPVEAAKRFVELAGGADLVLERLHQPFEDGDYRWVAEVTNKLVFADPSNTAARELGAQALEQLAYQQENPNWRNAFLTAALELIEGPPRTTLASLSNIDVVSAMTPELILDFLSVRLHGPKASEHAATIRWVLPEAGVDYLLELRNGIVIYTQEASGEVDATLTASKIVFAGLSNGALTLQEALSQDGTSVEGDANAVELLFSLLDVFPQMFNIVEP
jgi:alkyl sulfatase BDS1-like metallo-beta-lactamase superfamily hydrolase